MVIERCSLILDQLKFYKDEYILENIISPYEMFILLVAIQIHDTGHLISTRANHAKEGRRILSAYDKSSRLSAAEKAIIGSIAQAHGGKDDPINKLEEKMHLSHKKIRPQFLAALLRLSDELAEDETRASKILLEMDQIVSTSKIFHLYSASLNSIELSGKEISLNFYVTDKYLGEKFEKKINGKIIYQYLINEIYERSNKTHLEALYCSRFLPEGCRFTKVRAKINLISSESHGNIYPPIGFELIENGYPSYENKTVFELCNSLWDSGIVNQGVKIDGLYVSNLLAKE